MHPGSTGSLGRKWRPPLHQGLYLVPEDGENTSESTSTDPPTTRSMTSARRPNNVTQLKSPICHSAPSFRATFSIMRLTKLRFCFFGLIECQAYLKMVSRPKPGRAHSLPTSALLPGSPLAQRPSTNPFTSNKPPAPPPPPSAPTLGHHNHHHPSSCSPPVESGQ
ncbi:hypothetical protein FBUS_01355 [Fasciolopsis buskii]|uniref:Uncharacterized protein n=1 Tax=Fasciolopsis buskii TaxID=27845 RepID=A0A8E0RNG6_9TREM|nr:hypothetical protein FBUS_01355 [Fasciolopsis buski]